VSRSTEAPGAHVSRTRGRPLTTRHGPYELVAIDLDGTLVDAQNVISDRVERTIREVRSMRVEVVLVTGRPQVAALAIFNQLGLALPLISSGGAFISEPASGQVIAEVQPDPADIRFFVGLAREAAMTLVFQTPYELFGEGDEAILDELRVANATPIVPVDDGLAACPEPIKVTACGPRDRLEALRLELETRGLGLSLVYSGPEFLEVTGPGVSKGRALRRLADELGIPLERVLVIGDAPNDVSMFAEAGLAVAMGNAPSDVQSAAAIVAPPLDEDGVAWTLRRFVLDQPGSDDG
jgi:Cof subfamily protein (haloacid dehalogenase superfamily)